MRMTLNARSWLPAVAAVLALAGCGGSSGGEPEQDADQSSGASTAACNGLLKPADQSATPAGVDVGGGVTWYDHTSQGATQIFYGYLNGDDVVATRDHVADALKSKGLDIEGEDAEDNTEAEAEFGGAVHGTLQVTHLCQDHLRVRVTVE